MENEIDLIGAENYMNTTNALAGNILNLGAWFGYHELIHKNRLPFRKLEFDFILTDLAYFSIIYNKNNYGYSGFRLSFNSNFKNIYFKADNIGLFKTKKELNFNEAIIKRNKWNNVKLILTDNTIKLFINNMLTAEILEKNLNDQFIGFKGSSKNVYIDNIIVLDKNSKIIFKEDFSIKNKFIKFFLFFLLIISLLDLLILVIIFFTTHNFKIALLWILLIGLNLSFGTLIINIYLSWKSTRYPSKESLFKQEINPFIEEINNEENIELTNDKDENIEDNDVEINKTNNENPENIDLDENNNATEINFGDIKNDYLQDLYNSAKITIENNRNQYHLNLKPGVCRIVFIGTSQTWGSGARDFGETFVNLIEDNLNKKSYKHMKYECINASVQGMVSYQLFNIYRDYYLPFNPSLNIINLSNNDASDLGSPEVFSITLEKFIRLNNEHFIKTIFILESNSIENITVNIYKYHDIMRKIAEKHNIPVIDLFDFMNKNYDKGFIWWDNVHMSSAGHNLAAQLLTEKIEESIDDKIISTVKNRNYLKKSKEDVILEKIDELTEIVKTLSNKLEN
ncbi:MAG: SGNH/GDSL hydrolase family protein [Spirochaetes bacterium]|nr:SGNH/GDSL hydrolase family protein [Spirochaetota bacterium]